MDSSSGGYVKVVQPGPMTLVQDRGRIGYQQLGVSVSGAVDVDALDAGNILVGNDLGAAGLEVMLGGLELEFSKSTIVAVTGADSSPALDDIHVAIGVSFTAHPGSKLTLGMVSNGLRSYVAVAGGIAIKETLGSRSTHVASEIGGIDGRALAEGDILEIGDSSGEDCSGRLIDRENEISTDTPIAIRIVLGPQNDAFTADGIETLLNSKYTVTDQSNRQGLRLDGPEVESVSGRYDIISDAVVNGSIQVPGDGRPIILLADRQTTGGYVKVATVASVDLPKLGQATPGTTITFTAVSVDEAQDLLIVKSAELKRPDVIKVIEPYSIRVDGVDVQAGVANNGEATLAEINGTTYPIAVDEIIPAN